GGASLKGKTIIITGGASGIGLEATRVLANAGADVIVAARNPERARAALQGVAKAEVETLDLANPASIDAFAERFNARNTPLDILINNAGIMASPLSRDARGYEAQFATNHLGHFQLTARLWPALKRAGKARVVTLSSGAHRRSPILFDDIHFERSDYDKWVAYGQSKTANALFALALDDRSAAHGVRAFSAHPGVVPDTNLIHNLTPEELKAQAAMFSTAKTVPQGTATTIWCAIDPKLEGMGGVYCEDADISNAVPADKPTPGGVRPWAMDRAQAERLWTLSEQMTGVQFRP
ncbi:MAG: SDR family NAD(P)-dependent oxidoreductase, partial [Hyphomonadaceae bacterium]